MKSVKFRHFYRFDNSMKRNPDIRTERYRFIGKIIKTREGGERLLLRSILLRMMKEGELIFSLNHYY